MAAMTKEEKALRKHLPKAEWSILEPSEGLKILQLAFTHNGEKYELARPLIMFGEKRMTEKDARAELINEASGLFPAPPY